MTTLQSLLVGTFLMAYYYFVLRTYNTLGFRLFSLFFFTSIAVTYWWYVDYHEMKNTETTGIATKALILKKSANSLEFQFTDVSGKSVVRTQTGGISVEEFAEVNESQFASIVYSPQSDTVYLINLSCMTQICFKRIG